ncbi:cytidine deaminase [Rhodovibrionaceae bacterium A322]
MSSKANSQLQPLIDAARQAMDRAHAPYSNFPVGAALRGKNGEIYSGCNVENAAYPEGWCAETSAIAALVMGQGDGIKEVVVMGKGDALVTPCGGCRQRLREFAAPDTPIHICGPEGLRQTFTLQELLPVSFGPDNLD